MPPKKLSKLCRGRRLQLSQLSDAADRAKSIGKMETDNMNNDLGEDDPEHLTEKVTEINQHTAAKRCGITNTSNQRTNRLRYWRTSCPTPDRHFRPAFIDGNTIQ
jgi:hypothetical protein